MTMPTPAAPLLTVRDLAVTFGVRGQRAVHAVDEVSFEIRPGQHVGSVQVMELDDRIHERASVIVSRAAEPISYWHPETFRPAEEPYSAEATPLITSTWPRSKGGICRIPMEPT